MKQLIALLVFISLALLSRVSLAAMTCEAICLRKSVGITCDEAVRKMKVLKYEVESRDEAAQYLVRDCDYNLYQEAITTQVIWGEQKVETCLTSYVPSTLRNLKCEPLLQ